MFHLPMEELMSVLHPLMASFSGTLLLFHSSKYAHVLLSKMWQQVWWHTFHCPLWNKFTHLNLQKIKHQFTEQVMNYANVINTHMRARSYTQIYRIWTWNNSSKRPDITTNHATKISQTETDSKCRLSTISHDNWPHNVSVPNNCRATIHKKTR